MKIFLSHNSKDKPLAESLATSLRNEGHAVFFDKTDLPPGESFDDQIRKAIAKCDLFLFLVSPESISAGGYARTEIKFAQQKWKSPSGHVLSVMARPVADADLPPYLQSVTYLRTEGNLIAETLAAVFKLASTAASKRRLKLLSALGICLLIISAGFLYFVYNRLPSAFIFVSPFDEKNAALNVSRHIQTEIQKELDNEELTSVSIRLLDNTVKDNDQAQEIIKTGNAKAVIWGWSDNTRININIAVSPEKSIAAGGRGVDMVDVLPAEPNLSISATNLEQAAKTTALYIIGQLLYANNEYAKGHKAMDAAVKSLPKDNSVQFSNKALPEFLMGRQYFAEGKFIDAAIHYVKAINLNPKMSAAYNNLAITYAKLQKLYDVAMDGTVENEKVSAADEKDRAAAIERLNSLILEGPLSKLADASQTVFEFRLTPKKLFEAALSSEPANAAILYNKVAYSWEQDNSAEIEFSAGESEKHNYLTVDLNTASIKQDLEKVVAIDRSIPGAFAMLGAINFDDRNYSAAVTNYQQAVGLSPDRVELHNDLGLSYFGNHQYEPAKTQLELAVNGSQTVRPLTKLNLANVLIKLGKPEEAEKTIVKLLQKSFEESFSPDYAHDPSFRTDYELLTAVTYYARKDLEGFKRALNLVEEQFAKPGVSSPEPEPLRYGPQGYLVPPLDRLLTAWVLEIQGQADQADKLLAAISADTEHPPNYPTRFQLRYFSAAVPLTWYDLIDECAKGRPITLWGKGGDCLPAAPEARIQKVLDMYQDRLALDVFYRAYIDYADKACPYIYSHDDKPGKWLFETAILIHLKSQQLQGEQTQALRHFDGRLLLSEKEPETSYIDELYVTVIREDGSEVRLQAAVEELASRDGRYVILDRGLTRDIGFRLPAGGLESLHPKSYRVTAYGYYLPYRE